MEELLSACGLLCNECEFYPEKCQGCTAVKGSTFWAKEMMPDKTCPIFQCSCIEKGYNNCGQCNELPCKKFTDLKDPNASEEEAQKSLNDKIARLKSNHK
jgi:hypothetical protein